MYYKDDKIETENQDHGKEEKANMSVLKANSVAVIEHQIWFCLPGSHHYGNTFMPTSHPNRGFLT